VARVRLNASHQQIVQEPRNTDEQFDVAGCEGLRTQSIASLVEDPPT
jgi:hypothetical protein